VKAKFPLCLIKHHAMRTCRGVEIQLHAFLTSALVRGEWPALPPGRSPRCPWDITLGGPQNRYGRDGEEKNPFRAPAGNRIPVVQPVA
jgi:hypothetical protein